MLNQINKKKYTWKRNIRTMKNEGTIYKPKDWLKKKRRKKENCAVYKSIKLENV